MEQELELIPGSQAQRSHRQVCTKALCCPTKQILASANTAHFPLLPGKFYPEWLFLPSFFLYFCLGLWPLPLPTTWLCFSLGPVCPFPPECSNRPCSFSGDHTSHWDHRNITNNLPNFLSFSFSFFFLSLFWQGETPFVQKACYGAVWCNSRWGEKGFYFLRGYR